MNSKIDIKNNISINNIDSDDSQDDDIFEDALNDFEDEKSEISYMLFKSQQFKEDNYLKDSKICVNKKETNLNLKKIEEKLKNFKVVNSKDGIDACIKSTRELNKEFFANEFDFVIKFCEKNYDQNVCYALFYGTVYWLKTWLSFEAPEIQKCFEILTNCSEYLNKKRKVSSWSDYIRKVNFDHFTEEEVHAEICYAEIQFLLGAITFVRDQNFSSLIKGVLKLKHGYQSFKYCRDIYLNRTVWESLLSKQEFHSSLLCNSGMFNLALSNSPPKIISVLQFIGFQSNQQLALEKLNSSVNLHNTIKSDFALSILLSYYCHMQITIGWGDYSLEEFDRLVLNLKNKHPKSMFTNFFVAKGLALNGNIDGSISKFNEVILNSDHELKHFNNACYWELTWLYIAKKNWLECAKISDTMRKYGLWSPCLFTYAYAVSLFMINESNENINLKKEIDNCMREVPKLRKRMAGKSSPMEKLAMKKAEFYFSKNEKLVLPLHELMYCLNIPNEFAKNKPLLNEFVQTFDEELKKYNIKTIRSLDQVDEFCILLMMKGCFLRLLNFPSLAIEVLEQVITFSKDIKENHLIPTATVELAFCYMQLERYDVAKKYIKTSLSYSKYTAELILQIRAYNCLKHIKQKTKLENEID